MRVVDLADEFGMTTLAALRVCDAAGIAADDGGTELHPSDVERFRAFASTGADQAEPVAAAAASWAAPALAAPTMAPPPDDPTFAGSTFAGSTFAGSTFAGSTYAGPTAGARSGGAIHAVEQRQRRARRQVNTWAYVSLALGIVPIVGLYFGWAALLFAVPSLVAGRWADEFEARRRPDKTRFSTMAMVGRVTAVLISAFCMLMVWCWNTGVIDQRPSAYVADVVAGRRPLLPDGRKDVAPGGGVPIGSIYAGQCFTTSTPAPRTAVRADQLVRVACSEPHHLEVLHVYAKGSLDPTAARPLDYAANQDAPEVHAAVERACSVELHELFGVGGVAYRVGSIAPSADAWANGDRTIVCALVGPGDTTTVGPITGDG